MRKYDAATEKLEHPNHHMNIKRLEHEKASEAKLAWLEKTYYAIPEKIHALNVKMETTNALKAKTEALLKLWEADIPEDHKDIAYEEANVKRRVAWLAAH